VHTQRLWAICGWSLR